MRMSFTFTSVRRWEDEPQDRFLCAKGWNCWAKIIWTASGVIMIAVLGSAAKEIWSTVGLLTPQCY